MLSGHSVVPGDTPDRLRSDVSRKTAGRGDLGRRVQANGREPVRQLTQPRLRGRGLFGQAADCAADLPAAGSELDQSVQDREQGQLRLVLNTLIS